MTDTPKHSVSVAGVVVDDRDRVLVVQRRDNAHWEPPGGVLELDETPEIGTCREVLEETGIHVQVECLAGVYKNMSRGVIALVFRCRPIGGIAMQTDEAVAVRWIALDEVDQIMAPAYAIRVHDAFNEEVTVRSHNGTSLLPR